MCSKNDKQYQMAVSDSTQGTLNGVSPKNGAPPVSNPCSAAALLRPVWLEIRTWGGYRCKRFCENLPTAMGELFLAEAGAGGVPGGV